MKENVVEEKPGPMIHYTVDGSAQVTTVEVLTPQQILGAAGVTAGSHRLVLKKGDRQIACDNQPIRVRDEMEFVTIERNSDADQKNNSTAHPIAR